MATAVAALDDELTEQRVELALHGAAIKQLLEDRNRERDHNWQFRMLAATILLTNVGNVVAAILMHR